MADFNTTPQELGFAGFLDQFVFELLVPANVGYTCKSGGGGTMIDYGMANRAGRPFLHSIEAEVLVPFGPHAALRLHLNNGALKVMVSQIVRPIPFNKAVGFADNNGLLLGTNDDDLQITSEMDDRIAADGN